MEPTHDPLRRIPTRHAPEAKADIGTALKAARAKKGQTLENVAQQTRIPKKHLDALENNRFEEFPALAYLRGFLKQYCDYLDADFESLWKLVTAEPTSGSESHQPASGAALPAGAATPKPAPAPAPAPKPAAAAPVPAPKAAAAPAPKAAPKKEEPKPMAAHKPAPAPKKDDHGHGHAAHGHDDHGHGHAAPSSTGPIGPIMLALVLGVLGSIAFFASADRVPSAPHHAETPAGLVAAKPPTENTLSLTFKEDAFATVIVGGAEVFSAKVPAGKTQEWKSDKPVELKLSKPSAVEAQLNGSKLDLPAPDAKGLITIGEK